VSARPNKQQSIIKAYGGRIGPPLRLRSDVMYPVRKILRLKDYDYSQQGLYFITIVTQDRTCLYGVIENEKMHINSAGALIQDMWYGLPKKFTGIYLDEFVLMPNHIHGLVGIVQQTEYSISNIVQWYKTMTTNQYIQQVHKNGWQRFNKRLWQRGYYEHVVRNEASLSQIRDYIIYNPLNWLRDEYNFCTARGL
jgi:putative transposase